MRFVLALGLAFLLGCADGGVESPYKVYVILGFHGNFYHSWRGDTPDEAGFGQDIRIVREILRTLDDANARGLDARGYWDTENLFTYERIIPEHAPDIIPAIRRRVDAGLDEILLMPYDNGLIHAMTERELRANLRWAISNPWGSGVRDLFGGYTPLFRPQEMTLTTGALPILADEGIEGLVLLYAGVPFNAISAFVPPLPPEQRYGTTWLRLREDGPRMLLFPAGSVGDIVGHVSLEKWLLDLRHLQTHGGLERDLVIHVNADADGDFWLPAGLPSGLGWLPNAGGLMEHIEAVNRYAWAEFTTPAAFMAEHPPEGEVLVRQDLADGAFDGQYSWAEKFASHTIWSLLEQSRVATRRAEALAGDAPEALRDESHALLWEGRESSFFARVEGLSTTHFGMSTPIVNEERQAVAEGVAGRALARARQAERRLAAHVQDISASAPDEALYAFQVRDVRTGRAGGPARTLLRLPLLFHGTPPATQLQGLEGDPLPHALVNVESLGDGRSAAELWVVLSLEPGETRRLTLSPLVGIPSEPAARGKPPGRTSQQPPDRLTNGLLEVALDPTSGISSLGADGWQVGGPDFLAPFVSYRSGDEIREHGSDGWELQRSEDPRAGWLQRVQMHTRLPFETPEDGPVSAEVRVSLSLPDDTPWIVADVDVTYPYTTKRDMLHNPAQKLRRYLDLRWVEVAPFQLRPLLEGTRQQPLRVWKHNYLGVTSFYDLDYAQINPKNAEIDAFNHQVTAGWVAVSDRRRGLLLAEDADVRSSFAFAPMRLREQDGKQRLWLNPFGSYHGRQLDYTHTDGSRFGAELTALFSSSLHPNGPSYNGQRERFSLLLAPYSGDAPPESLRADAEAFFVSPSVVYLKVPHGLESPVRVPDEMEALVAQARTQRERQRTGAMSTPRAFLVNPTTGAADIVWDEMGDVRVEGYQLEWRVAETGSWQREAVAPGRRHRISGLTDGTEYEFRLRAVGAGMESEWTETARVIVGPVDVVEMTDALSQMSPRMIMGFLREALIHAWSTR